MMEVTERSEVACEYYWAYKVIRKSNQSNQFNSRYESMDTTCNMLL